MESDRVAVISVSDSGAGIARDGERILYLASSLSSILLQLTRCDQSVSHPEQVWD
jgi:hypothetical protein